MMKSSGAPNISAPLSRRSKKKSESPILLYVVGFVLMFGCALFGAVYLGMQSGAPSSSSSKQHRLKGAAAAATIEKDAAVEQPVDVNHHRHESAFGERHHHHFESQGQLIISTSMGDIKIELQPQWSPESVEYVKRITKEGCDRCTFYRAEKPGIFQGMMVSNSIPHPTVKGECPEEFKDAKQDCPPHDANCACHGPIMEKGMVGWAGGQTGPDWFIDTYKEPATHWGNTHTAWGKVMDAESLNVLTRIYELPVTTGSGMHYLKDNIKYTMTIK